MATTVATMTTVEIPKSLPIRMPTPATVAAPICRAAIQAVECSQFQFMSWSVLVARNRENQPVVNRYWHRPATPSAPIVLAASGNPMLTPPSRSRLNTAPTRAIDNMAMAGVCRRLLILEEAREAPSQPSRPAARIAAGAPIPPRRAKITTSARLTANVEEIRIVLIAATTVAASPSSVTAVFHGSSTSEYRAQPSAAAPKAQLASHRRSARGE